MLLQDRQRPLRVLSGCVLLLGGLLVGLDVLAMVRDHVLGEHLVERGAVHLRHFVVVSLLLGVWSRRRAHTQRRGGRRGLLVGGLMIGSQHLAEGLRLLTLTVLLREFAHL